MSVSDNSTLLAFAGDIDGGSQLSTGHTYGLGDRAVSSYVESPYTDTKLCTLEVGPNKTCFRVHRTVLSQSPELEVKPSSMLWGESTTKDSIALPDLDESTAHTLVHYLYSGRYQTLGSFDPASKTDNAAIAGYKDSTCVYCAAIRYKLPGLADLAKEKICLFGDDLTIIEILGVARDHAFPSLPEADTWFPAYLEEIIKVAGSQDPSLFMTPAFVDQIEGDRRFRQVVMKAVVITYSTQPSIPSDEATGASTPVAEDLQAETAPVGEVGLSSETQSDEKETLTEEISGTETAVQGQTRVDSTEEKPTQAAAEQPITDESVKQPTVTEVAVPGDDLKLDEIDPTPPVVTELEPFTDELGFKSSKTYQQINNKVDKANEKEAKEPSEVKPINLERSDSVIDEPSKDAADTEPLEQKLEQSTIVATADAKTPTAPAEVTEQEPKKKDKRKKKKKNAAAAAAVAAT